MSKFNFKLKYYTLLSLGIITASIAFIVPLTQEINSNIAIAQTQKPKPTNRKPKPKPKPKLNPWKRLTSILQRRHTKPLGARSGICPIAPGLIETYTVWHDKPLFLWHTTIKNQDAQLIVRDRDSEQTLWVQKVNIGDKKVFYKGQPLELGKLYQWKLENPLSTVPLVRWKTFQIMPANQRTQIQADLQRLQQKSLAANSEEIAIRKAEYFSNYLINSQSNDSLWADGLQALYQVEKPSQSFIEKREEFVANRCTQGS